MVAGRCGNYLTHLADSIVIYFSYHSKIKSIFPCHHVQYHQRVLTHQDVAKPLCCRLQWIRFGCKFNALVSGKLRSTESCI